MATLLIKTVVERIEEAADGIRTLTLRHAKNRPFPVWTGGAHVDVLLGNDLIRQYSLCSNPNERNLLQIGVLHDTNSRGGSAYIHTQIKAGDTLIVRSPRNTFGLVADAKRHLFLAGGIGITPFVAMIHEALDRNEAFSLHYCTRAKDVTAFRDELLRLCGPDRLVHYFDGGDPAHGCDLTGLLAEHAVGTHLYACGPAGLLLAAEQASRHWPADAVHFERFVGAEPIPTGSAEPFIVELLKSGKSIEIAADETILAALDRHEISLERGCETGACGACLVNFVDGSPIHRDVCLSERERQATIAPCVSRATGVLKLDI
ncbi:MAG: PDR/VanB family oxidoreductase [Hyphomicrobiaceae bacterium]